MDREPVVIVSIAEVAAMLFAAFGLDLEAEALVVTITTLVAVGTFIARKFSWSKASVDREVASAEVRGSRASRSRG